MATIGIYGFTADSFLRQLQDNGVRLLIDVRQRRGVRGAQYAWANSKRLQALLAGAQILYEHHLYLAPTTELRELQYAEDRRQGVGKRSRIRLGNEYVRRYTSEILDDADLGSLVANANGAGTAALMCVERDSCACHRSLIARRLEREYQIRIINLVPE